MATRLRERQLETELISAVRNTDRNDFQEAHLGTVRCFQGHPEVSMPRTPGAPVPQRYAAPALAINTPHVRDAYAGKLQSGGGQTGSQKRLRGGSLKQDMHKLQTDLIAPRTVQLTEQTPVVADHTVEKVSHGAPRCWNLRSVSG